MHATSTGFRPQPSGPHGLARVAARFEPATVEMLRRRALLRRTDTKFLMSSNQIIWLLAGVTNDYCLLRSANRQCLAAYRTIYYDTPDLLCFAEHQRGRRPRHKVRIRHYLDRAVTFFEIKTKGTNEMTTKYRVKRAFGDETFGEDERRTVARLTGLPAEELAPSTVIEFSRMTLLGRSSEERITIDVDLALEGAGAHGDLCGVSIVEVKQARLQRSTTFMRALRAHGVRPRSASKYSTALALGRPSVRTNRMLPVLRALERIQR